MILIRNILIFLPFIMYYSMHFSSAEVDCYSLIDDRYVGGVTAEDFQGLGNQKPIEINARDLKSLELQCYSIDGVIHCKTSDSIDQLEIASGS